MKSFDRGDNLSVGTFACGFDFIGCYYGVSDNSVTVRVFGSKIGSSFTENHRIEQISLTVTLFHGPNTVIVGEEACNRKESGTTAYLLYRDEI